MTNETPERAALDAAKHAHEGDVVTLSTGYRAKLKPVPAALLDAASSRIKNPTVPKWYNQEKEREEDNPNDPAYLAALEDIDRQRGLAGMDVMIIAGVQLVDSIPPDAEWLGNLKLLEKLGHVDLSIYDLNDPMEKEFVFKKLVAVSSDDYALIAERSGVRSRDLQTATNAFQS